MDSVAAQAQVLINGISWQLMLVTLFAAAFTEQTKGLPFLKAWIAAKKAGEKLHWAKDMALWLLSAFLPEALCIICCLTIPGVIPPGVGIWVAILTGYLAGTVSSKVYALVIKKLLGRIGTITGNGEKKEDSDADNPS